MSPGHPPDIHIHYLRPPDREEIFHQHLVHDGADGKVTLAHDVTIEPPVIIEDEVALETGSSAVWVTFPGVWHDIGRFHDAHGRFTGYYANILTPPEILEGGIWRTTDLFLDVWLPPPPRSEASVLDEEQLEEAVDRGWVESAAADRAHEEVRAILRGIAEGSWPPAIAREWTLERALSSLSPDGRSRAGRGPRKAPSAPPAPPEGSR